MISQFTPIASPVSKDNLHISFSKKAITGTLTIHTFMDGSHFVSYCPALQLSSYGDNKKEAMDRLLYEVIDDFFSHVMKDQSKGIAEFSRLGWKKEPFFKKRFVSEIFVDREGVLRNFNLPETTLIETSTVSTAVAA